MRAGIICFILLLVMLSGVEASAQSNKFMSLDIRKAATTKRIKYYEHDKIIFKLRDDNTKYRGTINALNDSALVIDSALILYKDIRTVLVDNSNSLTKVARAFLMTAGAGFITLDVINNAINSNSPIVNPKTVVIGVSLIITGQMFKWLSVSRYKINNNHRIKYIDDTP